MSKKINLVQGMSSLNQLQHDINHLAYTTFKTQCAGYSQPYLERFSIPLIPRITQEYFKHRLVIMGQETQTWYGKDWYKDKGKNNPLYKHFNLYDFVNAREEEIENICQVCRYDEFTLYGGAQKRKGFWFFNRKICKEVLNDPIQLNKGLPFCWLDLFCTETYEYDKGQPSQKKSLADAIVNMQSDLLYQILVLIKPKVILATTNHKNDSYLKNNALGDPNASNTAIDKTGRFSISDIASIDIGQGGLKGTKVIRTHHPNGLHGIMDGETQKDYKELIIDSLKQCY